MLSQRARSPLAYEGKMGNIPMIAAVETDGGDVIVKRMLDRPKSKFLAVKPVRAWS